VSFTNKNRRLNILLKNVFPTHHSLIILSRVRTCFHFINTERAHHTLETLSCNRKHCHIFKRTHTYSFTRFSLTYPLLSKLRLGQQYFLRWSNCTVTLVKVIIYELWLIWEKVGIACTENLSASVLLKLFINGNERCYKTDAP